MGVPSFYRWLLCSFPRAVVDAYKGNNPEETIEFDNLYLDMNGIIHPCFHPEGLPAPRTYDEVFEAVFKYIDAVFSIVKPRKLLFLAIDGVAPRAKMNQQRSRRFRAAREAAEEAAEREELGVNVSETQEEQSGKLDSNVITPGTEFMALLSSALQHYIRLRMNEVPKWKQVKVILSDASVPGEGEHKIMSYIRLQRNLPGYDPNTRHCLYGLDADLIMLALTTHEIHFSILREDIRRPDFFPKNRRDSSRMTQQDAREVFIKKMENYISKLKFQFLHVWILREYLAHALKIPDRTVKVDLERLIDDFVLMCLFVGNDFLPHVPSLEISEGAIDLLMEIYKKEFVRMGGYLTNSFEVNLARVKHILEAVGSHEGGILRKRMQIRRETDVIDQRFSRKRNRNRNKRSVGGELKRSALLDTNTGVDKIKYGEVGWKERYYAEKFEVETEDDRERIRRDVVLKYTEGICWVMHYYYQGVCSWQWFYPYHYAPLASDFHGIENLKIEFTLGQPFKPLDQLMAVLPSASAHALPLFYRKLMTEASSPLLAFYPKDFELDMNGKRFSWQAICKLPFIDESLLLSEIARVEHTLTDEERQRNRLGFDVLFVHISQPFAEKIVTFYKRNIGHPKLAMAKVKRKIDPIFSGGMNGYMFISDKPVLPKQIDSPIDGMQMIANNEVLSVFYGCPPYHEHIPRPPEEVAWPKKCIRKKDIKPKLFLWHEHTAVVGRLHSLMPVHKSIFGSRLAKSARQLVLTWCLEMQQKSRGSVERGEGARAHRVFCYDYYKTIDASVGDTSGDKSCTKGGFDKHLKGKQQKRKCEQNDIELSDRSGQSDKHALKGKKRKQNTGRELSDCSVGANGTALISNLQGKASAHDAGDDKGFSNGQSDKYALKGEKRKWNTGRELSDRSVGANGMALILNLQGKASARDAGDDKGHDSGQSDKHALKGKKRKRNTGRELSDHSVGANGTALILNLQGKASARDAGDDKGHASGQSDKHALKGKKRKRNNKHALKGKKRKWNTGRELSDHSVGANGTALILNLQGKASARDTGDDKGYRNGQSDKQAVVVTDNIQGGDEPTRQSKLDQTFGDKISIDGGSEKHERERKWKKGNMVPNGQADGLSCHANLEKGICADGTRGEETIAADESRKEAVGVLDNNQVGDELTLQLQMDRTVGDKSSIDGESGTHKKKQRQNEGNVIAAGICGSDIVPNEHEGTDGIRSRLILEKGICADEVQGEKTVVVESSKQAIGVPDNNQGREESAFQLQADQTAVGKSSIHEGTDGSFSHLNLEEGIRADEARGEKTMAVESSKQPIGVPDNIVGGVESTISNSREAVNTTPTETNGNSMDGHVGEDGLACHFNGKEMVLVDESIGDENGRYEKQQRGKRKKGELDRNVIKPNDPDYCSFSILDNNIVVKDSTAIQIT